ncbi:LysE family transporter [Curtobacterium sp. 1310]|uniref:LysE/ArgO family amino acid transporter n=1 Tax=Curtobacterium sp. 1310 TaxID=2806570 RepID=UPI001B55C23D|nr:LysE family transporter [Curtobacterium sp. 1310]MBP1302003.1 L-lysine exporter family protein LysE/ArgO [Curtobacterium sp. 1310]
MTVLLPLFAGLGTGLALIVAIGVQNAYLLRLAVSAPARVVAAAVAVCAVSDAVLIVAGVLGVGVVVERFPVALVVVRFVGAAFLVVYGVLAARRAFRPTGEAMAVEQEAADDGVVAPTTVAPTAVAAPATASSETAAQAAGDPGPAAGRAARRADDTVVPDGGGGAAGRSAEEPPGRTTTPAVATRTASAARAVPTLGAAVATMLVFTWANPHVYLDTLVFLGSVANQQGVDDRWWWTVGAVAASCLWFGALGFGGRLLRPLFAKPLTWRVFDGLVAVVMLSFGVALAVGA